MPKPMKNNSSGYRQSPLSDGVVDYKDKCVSDLKEVLSDPRFNNIGKDARLRRFSNKTQKVELDSRFSSIFTDDRFGEKNPMDPRGRPTQLIQQKNLGHIYHLPINERKDVVSEQSNNGEEATKTETETEKNIKYGEYDYARGQAIFSEDSSDDDSSTTEEEDPYSEFEWGELDKDAERATENIHFEPTRRFAVCNMAWNYVMAADLFKLFTSFLPSGGALNRVAIYLSDYGRERLSEEEKLGPAEFVGQGLEDKEKDLEKNIKALRDIKKGNLSSIESEEVNYEALRHYERKRLKYYYAVVECDSEETAKHLFNECESVGFEGVGLTMDMRYITDDMQFDEEPKDVATCVPDKYQCKEFFATCHLDTRPTLTWDQVDPDRKKVISCTMKKALKGEEVDEEEIKGYIASSSDEGEESSSDELGDLKGVATDSDDEQSDNNARKKRIAKFRDLIADINRKEEEKLEMRKIWADDSDDENDIDLQINLDKEEVDESPKKGESDLTPFEEYLERRKKKKKIRDDDPLVSSEDEGQQRTFSDDNLPEDAENLIDNIKGKKVKKKMKKKTKGQLMQLDNFQNNTDSETLALLADDSGDEKHFSMKDIVKATKDEERRKRKHRKDVVEPETKIDDFQVNLYDSRFTNILTSGAFHIDPSHAAFKKTKTTDTIISEIQKRRMAESFEFGLPSRSLISGSNGVDVGGLVTKLKKKKIKQ